MMKKIETLAQYMELASRTCVDLGSKELNMFHMQSGIVTEIGEAIDPIKKHIAYGKPLDMVNVGEEIADICWYLINRARMVLPSELKDQIFTSKGHLEALEDWRETFNKHFVGKTEHQKLILAVGLIYSCCSVLDFEICNTEEAVGLPYIVMLQGVCEQLGLDFWQILTNNIAKLQVRYPEKFTNEDANNRDLDAERKELEKDESNL
jgi:NTP pyrophosphatase (non-canonical NTP hydrolase)